MIKVQFKLKDPNGGSETSIRLVSYVNGERLVFGTSRSILPELWDSQKQRPTTNRAIIKKYSKLSPYFEGDLTNLGTRLDKMKGAASSFCTNLESRGLTPTKEGLYNHLDEMFNQKEVIVKATITLRSYIDQFIGEITSGERLTDKGGRYTKGTIKNYNSFKKIFNAFQSAKKRVYDFDDINIDFYNDYVAYFNNLNYSPNSIGKHVKHLKTIMRAAKFLKLHNNIDTELKSFKTLTIETDEIYLNQNEIKKIYDLDLSKRPELIESRDVFLVGCYLAQRYSDYSRINPNHIKVISGGTRVIVLNSKKTNTKVVIPINYELDHILKKYDYRLPKTYEQKVNKDIKTIGRLAKLDEYVEIEMVRGGMKVKKTVRKYDLIKTHTARRSGATNMFLAGIPTLEIMKITGHNSEASLRKYLKATTEETAIKLSLHPYFSKMAVI